METSLFNRLQATLLAIATAGLVLLAVLNFRQESQFQQPDDGVWWMEAANGSGLEATKVLPNSPAERAGIHLHDLLTGVNGDPVVHLSDLDRELYRTGVYTKAEYSITRRGIQLDEPVVVIP
ncbi:MAG: PDZ domain-containing protein, partial [Terracidiphilus sp.]